MIERLAADALVLVHLAFIAFVVAGGALVVRDPRWSLAHLPAAAWGAYAELTATLCPLTPLENALRRRAGQAGYDGGFVEHYLIPLVYPPGLTPAHQAWLGVLVVAINAAFYGWAWRRARRRRVGRGESA
ncbi:MAG: hypothetical protein BroJett026_22590 [Betaproteobacteria bacterium]|nr:MAG: hypothetical protein BroJett026_22590 [Betaproteobacteria bacterium]